MNVTLYGRQHKTFPLDVIDDFPTYAKAVYAGQQLCGHGNFLIDTGDRRPTREEQLLKTKDSRKERLDSL